MATKGEIPKRGRADRRAHWQSHIEGWKESGQSKRAYCREKNLSCGSFYRWCSRLSKETAGQPSFIPVRLPMVAAPGHAVELTLRNGRVLRIGGAADPAWLSRLVEALDRAC